MKIRGDINYAPYEFLDDDGQPQGFNVDIVRAVANVMNLKMDLDLGPWSEVRRDLEQNRIDIITGMFYSEERDKLVDFSTPFIIVSHSVFVRKDTGPYSLDDLKGKEIIVEQGDIMHDYLIEKALDFHIVVVHSQIEALQLLNSGKHDCALLGRLAGLYNVDKYGFDNIIAVGTPVFPHMYCIAVNEGNTILLSHLNEGLSLIKTSGEYDRIYNKWFGVYEKRDVTQTIIHYAMLTLVPISVLLALALLWSWSLRRKVATRTRELNTELAEYKQTELKLRRFQQLLGNVIDSMPSMLIGVDTDLRIIFWNNQAESFTGITADQAKNHLLTEVSPLLAEQHDEVSEAIRLNRINEDSKVPLEIDGESRLVNITTYPLTLGDIRGAVVRIDDVTERSEIEKTIIQTEKMMSLGGMAAGMAHELNSPLSGISQSVQIIQQRLSPDLPKNHEIADECGMDLKLLSIYLERRSIDSFLSGVRESVNRASQIITGMLNFSRKSSGKTTLESVPAILDHAIELAKHEFKRKIQGNYREIEVAREYQFDLPPIPVIAVELEQVFLNIFKNGVQAMSETAAIRKPQFIVRAHSKDNLLIVEIADNGPGMDNETSSSIFEPFFTTKKNGSGTGLGLSVSKMIITEHHGGSITVQSSPGQGCCFIISLPMTTSEPALKT